MGENPTSWSQRYARRQATVARFPDPLRLPLARRPVRVIQGLPDPPRRVLEIGAHDRKLEGWLRERYPRAQYRSFDVDPAHPHDFRRAADVDGGYDQVWAFEVIEHLDVAEGLELLVRVRDWLLPGGRVILTTPNICCPAQYLRDVTHRTPYAHDELGASLAEAGLELEAFYRLYQAPWLWRQLRVGLLQPVHRLLGVDFAGSIMAVARRPSS